MSNQEIINLSEDFERLNKKLESVENFVFEILKTKNPEAWQKLQGE